MKTDAIHRILLSGALFLIAPFIVFAQHSNSWLQHLTTEDSAAINALVLYPDTVRLSIFEACKYPEVIVRIAALQKNTSNEFTGAISNYSRDEQEDFWNLTRYPELIDQIVAGGTKNKSQLKVLVADYPEEIRDIAIKYGTDYYNMLQIISQQQAKSSQEFNAILNPYPQITWETFQELVYFPEVLSILNDHLQMTVLMGDMYNRDPQWAIHTADSLNLVVAQQNAAELQAWKNTIEENPELQNDLKNASSEYVKDNGGNDNTYQEPPPANYMEHYVCYPYSYWFGYPYWYPYYYWYPYPYWFDWGFYYDPFGHFVVFGMPSYYFTYWYFYHPYHYYDYPYLCNGYVEHYYGPRGGHGDNANVVRDWVNENNTYLPKDFVSTTQQGRVNAIRQLGKFETDWSKQTSIAPITRDAYFKEHAAAYPALNADRSKAEVKQQQMQVVPREKVAPEKLPAIKMPVTKDQEGNKTKRVLPQFDFNKVNPAQEYHKSIWERSQPSQNVPGKSVAPAAPAKRLPSNSNRPR